VADSVATWPRTRPLSAYFLLVFIAAWLVWLPMVALAQGLVELSIPSFMVWAAGLAPIGSATLITMPVDGRSGLRLLYGRFFVRGVPFRWYAIAAALPAALGLAAVWIRSLAVGQALGPSTLSLAAMAVGQGILFAPVAIFEEVGWRGFALPRLQARFSALESSLALGLIWAAWHLPLGLLGTTNYADMNPVWWTAEVLAAATLITWLFNNGRGSLWLPCLYHGASNMTIQTLVSPAGAAYFSVVVVAAALVVAILFGSTHLSRSRPRITAPPQAANGGRGRAPVILQPADFPREASEGTHHEDTGLRSRPAR